MKELQEILKGDMPVLIDFYADWCGPCQAMSPILADIKEYYSEKIKLVKVNVDKEAKTVSKYNVFSVPTFILFKNGEIVWKVAGMRSRRDFKTAIDKVL